MLKQFLSAILCGALLACSSEDAADPSMDEMPQDELPSERMPSSAPPVDALVLPIVVDQGVSLDAPDVITASGDESQCTAMPDCTANAAPELGAPIYEIDGEYYSEAGVVESEEHLRVLIPFEDSDCNLACGSRSVQFTSNSDTGSGVGAGGEPLPANVPCGTQETNTYLGAFLSGQSLSNGGVPQETHERYEYRLRVSDVCGARSNEVVYQFSTIH